MLAEEGNGRRLEDRYQCILSVPPPGNKSPVSRQSREETRIRNLKWKFAPQKPKIQAAAPLVPRVEPHAPTPAILARRRPFARCFPAD